jgi:molybdopterin converting factor small subunit
MTDVDETISVKLFAGIEERTPERRAACQADVRSAPTAATLLDVLGLEPAAFGLILVNGVHAGGDQARAAGDEMALFSPLGGG